MCCLVSVSLGPWCISLFLTLALVPSQSTLDQSNSWNEGCGAPCLQSEHDRPNLSHVLVGIGGLMSILSSSKTFESGVLSLLIFIGLNLFLPDHLALIIPVAHFLGFLGILGGVENWNALPLLNGIVVSCLLSSWQACVFHLKEGKVLLSYHGVNIMDSMIWPFLYV